MTAHREAAEEAGWWELGLSSAGVGNGGSVIQGDWDLSHEEVEYGRAVY